MTLITSDQSTNTWSSWFAWTAAAPAVGVSEGFIYKLAFSSLKTLSEWTGPPPAIPALKTLVTQYLAYPMKKITEQYTDSRCLAFVYNSRMWSIGGHSTYWLTKIPIDALLEEVYLRGVIQKLVLPLIGTYGPESTKKILQHPVTRVVITAILFSAMHNNAWTSTTHTISHFVNGLVWGTIAEQSSIFPAAITHTFYNLFIDFHQKGGRLYSSEGIVNQYLGAVFDS
jgi:membrane protease YdiL (CAAX protease family)